MKIASFSAYHLRVPLKMTIKHASHARSENETVMVACRLSDGTVGWGEGLPRLYVTGETIDSVFEQLASGRVVDHFLGNNVDDLSAVVSRCRSLDLGPHPTGVRSGFGNSLRCAIELSVLDAVTRRLGLPLSAVFDEIPEVRTLRRKSESVRYSAVFTDIPLRKLAKYSLWGRLAGMRHFKVKVGVEGNDDVARLRLVRRAIGRSRDLRIDANEAWNAADLLRRLEQLEPFNISAVEQPVPHEQLAGLAGIRGRFPIPIMLDESIATLDDLDVAVGEGYCDLINLRLSKCGGLISTALLAAAAHRQGMGYQLGCQVGETGILSAAGRHIAASLDHIRYCEGSYDRYILQPPLLTADLSCRWSGRAPALTSPGLGVDVDVGVLRRLTVRERHWTAASPTATSGGRA